MIDKAISDAASVLGALGGKASGKCKQRTHEQCRAAALKAWESKRTPMPQKFWNKVVIGGPGDCWPYRGPFQHMGHGTFKLNGKHLQAHRVAYELSKNISVPPGKLVCHHCDNPPCCNPGHLYVGTHKTNGQDASQRKRFPLRKGEAASNSKLSNEQAYEIRKLYRAGGVTWKQLAEKFGVVKSTIGWIIANKHYVSTG